MPDKTITLQDVYNFFKDSGITLREFSAEWKLLTEKDKDDFKSGIADGSLNY